MAQIGFGEDVGCSCAESGIHISLLEHYTGLKECLQKQEFPAEIFADCH